MPELNQVNVDGTLYIISAAAVAEKSITEDELSDSLMSKIGIERDPVDHSVDIRDLATIRAVRWTNDGPVTSGTLNCVEFTFDMDDVAAAVPEGLSPGVNLMLFGMNDDVTYYTKYLFTHNSTVANLDKTANVTGKRLVPAYADLDTVQVYVFGVTSPTATDIATIKQNLTAKVCDIVYSGSVECNSRLNSNYTKTAGNVTVFMYGNARVKTIQHLNISDSVSSFTISGFNASFAQTFSHAPNIFSAMSYDITDNYFYFTCRDSENINPVSWAKITFVLPASENVVFWIIGSSYIGENTLILDNKSDVAGYALSEEDISFIKEQYPQLGDYCGPFDRVINLGKAYRHSNLWSPPRQTADYGYFDIFQHGQNGDWYIFNSFSDLCIKNSIATYGDIIYRKDNTTYLVLENPIKWGNYKTVPPKSYDIVIVGGGAGGIGAAYALRNSGLKVLLADKMPGLGGTHTQAGLTSFISSPIGDWFKPLCRDADRCGALRFKTYTGSLFGETHTFDDYWDACLASYKKGNVTASYQMVFSGNWLSRRYHSDLTSGGIEIRYRRKFLRHTDIDGTITSLVFLNELTGAEEKVYAKYVIDCTGNAYVGTYNRTLDTDYYLGSDPYSRFNEAAASNIQTSNHYDINTCEIIYQYGGYTAGAVRSDYVAFTNTDPYADQDEDFPVIDGIVNKENAEFSVPFFSDPGDATGNPYTNSSNFPGVATNCSPDSNCGITTTMLVDNGEEKLHEIADMYARAHYRVHRKNAERYYIKSFPLLAMREFCRMKCEYMVTQDDVEDTITSENYEEKEIVALSAWYADIHKSTSVQTGDINSTFRNGIPYGALVPTSYKNLLIACRGYGASHIGLSGMRLIKTMMSLGRAAGFAAKQCAEDRILDVRDVDVAQVQSDAGVGTLLAYLETNVYPYIDAMNNS